MSIDEMMEVMAASRLGAKIQLKERGTVDWQDVIKPMWNWSEFDYRIKPERKDESLKEAIKELLLWVEENKAVLEKALKEN